MVIKVNTLYLMLKREGRFRKNDWSWERVPYGDYSTGEEELMSVAFNKWYR